MIDKSTLFYIHDEKTWPLEIIEYLGENLDYGNHEGHLKNLLFKYSLHGYHCTRLTSTEIEHILSNGMSLPNGNTLKARIQVLEDEGVIPAKLAIRLKEENQASDNNRAGKIWFCFFPHHNTNEFGINRFFKSWGGEALYNSHEKDVETGSILKRIGTPCIVEAIVPIESLGFVYFLEQKIVRQYKINRGYKTVEPTKHEDYAISAIPAQNIISISKFPEQKFIELTNCNTWSTQLLLP